MIPKLFEIPIPFLGNLPVNSFGLMIALSFLVGIQRLSLSFKRNGLNPQLAEKYVFVAGFVGLFGARFWYIVRHWDETGGDLIGAIFSSAGFTFYGGFILAALALVWLAKRDKFAVSTIADALGPALALAYAIGRVGCQLSGDGDYGIATTSFLGMSYATGVIPTAPGILALPAPLYESVASLLILFVVTKLEVMPNWQAPYRRFGAYLSLVAVERFLVEFVRIESKAFSIFSEAQVIAVGLMLIGLFLMYRRVRTAA